MQDSTYTEDRNIINNIPISSWNDLSDRLYDLAENHSLLRLRSRYVYRGMQDTRFGLNTTLTRLGEPYHELEAPILASFNKVCANRTWH